MKKRLNLSTSDQLEGLELLEEGSNIQICQGLKIIEEDLVQRRPHLRNMENLTNKISIEIAEKEIQTQYEFRRSTCKYYNVKI